MITLDKEYYYNHSFDILVYSITNYIIFKSTLINDYNDCLIIVLSHNDSETYNVKNINDLKFPNYMLDTFSKKTINNCKEIHLKVIELVRNKIMPWDKRPEFIRGTSYEINKIIKQFKKEILEIIKMYSEE